MADLTCSLKFACCCEQERELASTGKNSVRCADRHARMLRPLHLTGDGVVTHCALIPGHSMYYYRGHFSPLQIFTVILIILASSHVPAAATDFLSLNETTSKASNGAVAHHSPLSPFQGW